MTRQKKQKDAPGSLTKQRDLLRLQVANLEKELADKETERAYAVSSVEAMHKDREAIVRYNTARSERKDRIISALQVLVEEGFRGFAVEPRLK
jgi:hypothetical protein